jgi:hypothetical protein
LEGHIAKLIDTPGVGQKVNIVEAERRRPQMNADGRRYKHEELTRKIIGTFYEVYNELGFGFLESVYCEAMAIALRAKGLQVDREFALRATFRGQTIGEFRADLLVNGPQIKAACFCE